MASPVTNVMDVSAPSGFPNPSRRRSHWRIVHKPESRCVGVKINGAILILNRNRLRLNSGYLHEFVFAPPAHVTS